MVSVVWHVHVMSKQKKNYVLNNNSKFLQKLFLNTTLEIGSVYKKCLPSLF